MSTPDDKPILFSENWINGQCAFTINHEDTNNPASNAYDRDVNKDSAPFFSTSGANSDATQLSFEVDFPASRTIDTIIFIGHNLKTYIVQYWDGAAWQTLISETGVASDVTKSTAGSPVATTKIKLLCSVTQVADQEKAFVEFIACLKQFEFPQGLNGYAFGGRDPGRKIVLGNGDEHRVYLRSAAARRTKWALKGPCQFFSSPETDRLALESIIENGLPFLIQAEPDSRPSEIYLCNWNGRLSYRYAGQNKESGYLVDLDVAEV